MEKLEIQTSDPLPECYIAGIPFVRYSDDLQDCETDNDRKFMLMGSNTPEKCEEIFELIVDVNDPCKAQLKSFAELYGKKNANLTHPIGHTSDDPTGKLTKTLILDIVRNNFAFCVTSNDNNNNNNTNNGCNIKYIIMLTFGFNKVVKHIYNVYDFVNDQWLLPPHFQLTRDVLNGKEFEFDALFGQRCLFINNSTIIISVENQIEILDVSNPVKPRIACSYQIKSKLHKFQAHCMTLLTTNKKYYIVGSKDDNYKNRKNKENEEIENAAKNAAAKAKELNDKVNFIPTPASAPDAKQAKAQNDMPVENKENDKNDNNDKNGTRTDEMHDNLSDKKENEKEKDDGMKNKEETKENMNVDKRNEHFISFLLYGCMWLGGNIGGDEESKNKTLFLKISLSIVNNNIIENINIDEKPIINVKNNQRRITQSVGCFMMYKKNKYRDNRDIILVSIAGHKISKSIFLMSMKNNNCHVEMIQYKNILPMRMSLNDGQYFPCFQLRNSKGYFTLKSNKLASFDLKSLFLLKEKEKEKETHVDMYNGYGFVQPIKWKYERIIWIGYEKNSDNDKCLIAKMPKAIVKHIVSFFKYSITLLQSRPN